jgi:hypothetical protein
LSEQEQILFARLSEFPSDFSQDEAIAKNVLDGLINLVAKSLVVHSFSGGSVGYRLLETTRAYAAEKFRLKIQIEQPLRLLHNPRVKSGNFTGALPWATEVLLNGAGADQAAPSYTSISGGSPSRMHCNKR